MGQTSVNIPYHNKALPKGTILREWELEQVLGVGGFGIVYRAKGVYFGEVVAIKEYFPGAISDRQDGTTVSPTDSSSEETYALGLQKFLEEAKVLWGLSKPERHPNIVNVRSLFEIHGTAYMVMDFESGVSLSQMLRDGHKFDEASLLALIGPIAEGLDRAHRAGVLHRDIKPANILIDDSGKPVLIDFGSARFDSGQATNTKVTFYTPPYAAIEQYVKTYPQGPWTDIYALGVALYQCVTHEKPPEVLERLHGELGEPLSARQWPGFSRAFTRAVDAAMGIRPQERPQSIAAWLKMFDAEVEPPADDATRIGTRITQVLAEPPALWAKAVPVSTANSTLAKKVPDPQIVMPVSPRLSRGRVYGAAAAAALLATVGFVAYFLLLPHGGGPAEISSPLVAVATPTVQHSVEEEASGLLADAQRLGRPQREIAILADSNTKISGLAAQVAVAGQGQSGIEKARTLIAQMNDLAADMSRNEAVALGRAGRLLSRDILQSSGNVVAPDSASAMNDAKTKLDAAVAAVGQIQDATLSLQAARRALVAYSEFATAYGGVAQIYVAAQRDDFASLTAAARDVSGKVAGLAAGPKPWLLASGARKQAYQALQDNAAQAAAQISQLDLLTNGMPAMKDLKQVSAAVTQATAIKNDLDGLLAKSTAAYAEYNK